LIHGTEKEDEYCPFKETLKTKKVQSIERYEKSFDRYFSVKSSPIFDENGEIIKFVDLMRDITKLKSIEKELREANATKDRFFSLISHDIKNPLINLVYGNEIILEHLDVYDKDKIRHFTEEMLASSKHLLELLKELLTWAKFQRGKMEFAPKSLELKYVISSDVELLAKVADQKGISLKNRVADDVMAIIDYHMIRTVGRNLINNAIKFTAPGGEVVISANDSGRFVEVSVSDTGVGMTPEKMARLFKIAEEGISTKGTSGEKGTGLGLILCKEFVEKHGGKIWVESAEGNGSTFKFTLPKDEPVNG
jgi:signal transduction histidine kinase